MQQNNFQAKFRAALAISQMDKKNRAQNKGQTQNQLHQTIVEHNGLKSTYFMGHNEIPEIDENAIVVAEHDISVVTKKEEPYKTPKLDGMLLKKSPHFLQGWQQRWAVCQNNRLVYYLPENRNSPFGVLDFNIMSYSLQETKDQNGNIIEFVYTKCKVYIQCVQLRQSILPSRYQFMKIPSQTKTFQILRIINYQNQLILIIIIQVLIAIQTYKFDLFFLPKLFCKSYIIFYTICRLIPSGSTKNFIFKAGTSQETMKWFHVIRENKDTSEGAKKILNSLIKYPRFWRTDRISCDQFLKTGDTGDILLFRGNGANCLIQRGLTGSDYDHAAVLLRFPSGSLFILEATGCYGVGLCSWKDMINERWFELYEKIMIRKLEIDRDHNFLKTVQEFLNENMGKKYSLTPMKLLKQKSTVQDINKQTNKEERTFFCSELVAALYKQLGIFDQQKSAAQYWPGNLCSENKQLIVLKGTLHPEQLIDFSNV